MAVSQPQTIDLFGNIESTTPRNSVFRTKAGALSSGTLKAIKWYALEHQLKLLASSAIPVMSFGTQEGTEQTVHIDDVLNEYDQFKRTTHGKRQNA